MPRSAAYSSSPAGSGLVPGTWVAQRRDNRQTITAGGPEELREAIREDYRQAPVSR